MNRLFTLFALCLVWVSGAVSASDYVEAEFLVRFKDQIAQSRVSDFMRDERIQSHEILIAALNLHRVVAKTETGAVALMRQWRDRDEVKYVQRNHRVSPRNTPDDPELERQWNLNEKSGVGHISAEAAWDIGTGGTDILGARVVVAVVDGGVDIHHPDLSENIWKNSDEIPDNGVDDDGNGYVDDVNGWNAYNDSGEIPKNRHGTHVAGIIGAKGNNGIGGSGVNWDVDVMAVAGSSGTTAVVAKAYGYVMVQKKRFLDSGGAKGANVVATNSSFGVNFGECDSEAYRVWNDLYDSMGELGILSAAATANLDINVDDRGDVPTGCSSPYIISVTNTDAQNKKYGSAAFGKTHVDLGAPGTGILSTLPDGKSGELTGTSMATPHVAGAVALMSSVVAECFAEFSRAEPGRAALDLKKMLLDSVEPVADLKDSTVSGGKLNLYGANRLAFLTGCVVP